ncbi:MAG: hypothetical protein HQK78_06165, partial [Desulfobacterales bacterium]|nr:hypothetical protein [Desulfobacterales bacterium]
KLKTKYSSDKMIFSLLQLHESMAKYIRSKKINAHPDSMKLVHSVFEGLDKIIAAPNMTEDEKKKIAVGELKLFKAFKQKIGPAVKGAAPRIEGIDIEAIRKVIKAELSLFKEELLKEMKSMRIGR